MPKGRHRRRPCRTDAYGSGPRPAWLDVDWSAHQRWVEVDGRPLNAIVAGPEDAPALVFVHGHSACWQHWLEQLPAFMDDFRVVALDLPGFGRSAMPDEVSMQGYGRTLDTAMDVLGLEAACVVGNSMGGFVATELAIQVPERVERLVLVAAAGLSGRYLGLPTAFIRHPTAAQAGRVLFGMGGVSRAQARALARRPRGRQAALGFVCTHPELLHPATVYEIVHHGTGRPGAAPAAVDLATYDFADRVEEVACPTLVVWGDRDYLVPTSCAHEYHRRITDSRLLIYEDTGHLPMIERPSAFNADLRAFLEEEPNEDLESPAKVTAEQG